MKSNIIKAAINLGCIPGTKILEFYKEIGRDCADVKEAAFDYIQDIFAGTVREEDAATRAKKLKMTFDPDAEDYPTMAVGGGDGDVIILNRISDGGETVVLPEPITPFFTYDEDEECYKSGGDENRALYITVVTDGDLIKGVYMLYGEQYKALAGDGTEVENGRTAVSKVFDCLDCKFEAVAVIPKEYYGTLHMQNRLELESLIAQQTALFEKEVEIDGVPCLIIYSQR